MLPDDEYSNSMVLQWYSKEDSKAMQRRKWIKMIDAVPPESSLESKEAMGDCAALVPSMMMVMMMIRMVVMVLE